MTTARDLIRKAGQLSTISHAALKLVGLLDRPSVANEEVVEVLKYDTVLTAKLLRACNSSYFGFEEQISSVDQAVLILGHQKIMQLVLTLTFDSAMSVPLPGYGAEARELWSHSLHTALGADTLARHGIPLSLEPSVAFTAGLLHDIGKLVLERALTPETRDAIRFRIAEGAARAEAEKEIIGLDHAEVGGCLLEQWKLPAEIIEAVAHHHAPMSKPKPRLSALIHVANCLAHLAGSAPGWDGFAVRTDPQAITALAITPETLPDMIIAVHDSASQVQTFMSVS